MDAILGNQLVDQPDAGFDGGLFTNAFLKAVKEEAGASCPDWNVVTRKLRRPLSDGYGTQHPVVQASISRIPPPEGAKAGPPLCTPPPLVELPTETVEGDTDGWFEGRTGDGQLELAVEGTRVSGTFKGKTTTMGAAPQNGRRVLQRNGNVVTVARNPDGTRTTVTLHKDSDKVTIAVLNKDGSITTTVQKGEGLSGGYGFETSGHHPQHPDRHYGFSRGEWYWHAITFSGTVANALFDAASGMVRGTMTGNWEMSIEHCDNDCGPTTGPARASFSVFIRAASARSRSKMRWARASALSRRC